MHTLVTVTFLIPPKIPNHDLSSTKLIALFGSLDTTITSFSSQPQNQGQSNITTHHSSIGIQISFLTNYTVQPAMQSSNVMAIHAHVMLLTSITAAI